MGNPFVHVELNTTDAARAKQFYGALFDWKLVDMSMGGGHTYTMIDVGQTGGQGVGGGLQTTPSPGGGRAAWLSYVAVSDLAATIARARSLGAQILEERIEVPGMGAMGLFIDPTGAPLGLWEPAMPAAPRRTRRAPAKKAPARKAPAKKAARKQPAAKKPARKPARRR